MGKTDSAAKECLSDNVRFADLCNAVLFGGEQVVKADQLTEKDSTEVLSVLGADPKQIYLQKWRDILKNVVVKTDNNVCFVLFGVEAQANIHYAMPVRNMIYDALNYGYQVKEAAGKHKRNKDTKSPDEFLAGFTSEDRITPVITITVYLGNKNWDAPRCLADMYGSVDERLKPYLQDFDAHVFVPSEFDDFGKFQTELKQIFEVLSAAGDKSRMKQILSEDEMFRRLDNNTVRTINDIAGTKISLNEKGEVVNMCKAWEEQYEDGVAEGLSRGIEKGKRDVLYSLVDDGCLDIEEAARRVGMSEAAFLDAMEAAGYKVTVEA